jgi:acetyltransferase-like isoleucine patch superfamily enzyme
MGYFSIGISPATWDRVIVPRPVTFTSPGGSLPARPFRVPAEFGTNAQPVNLMPIEMAPAWFQTEVVSMEGTQRTGARRGLTGGYRLSRVAVGLVRYVTNHLVNHVPAFWFRRIWYAHMLGIPIGRGSGIHIGCYLWFYGLKQLRTGGLTIGEHTWINRDCLLDARDRLVVGSNVSISPGVAILTTQHDPDSPDFALVSKPITIEDHVWIGTRAMIMPGVRLGRGCVVAAGAVVTRHVPPMEIVAGVPARRVRTRGAEPRYTLSDRFGLFE